MTDQRAQLDQLTDELNLVQGAMSPKDAGKSLRDFMDSTSKSDALAGTADGPNPWLQVPASGKGCCVVS